VGVQSPSLHRPRHGRLLPASGPNEKQCSIHEHSPFPCRGYDCRNDKRIRSEYASKRLGPEFEKLYRSENKLEP